MQAESLEPARPAGGFQVATAPATRAGRARARLLAAVARIRSPLFWRLFYGLLAREAAVRAAARALRLADRIRPGVAATTLTRLGDLLVQSGWPNQSPGWVNLDTARFFARTTHALTGRRPTAPRPPRAPGERVRMGLVGEFGRPLIFSAEHFRAVPEQLELTVFDIAHTGRHAGYLAELVSRYEAFPALRGPEARRHADALAAAVNAADLDVLVFMSGPGNAYEVIDAIETPCVGFVTVTSNLLFHDRAAFQVYCQPEADYFFRNASLFCGLTRAPFRQPGVVPGFLLLGSRGFQRTEQPPPWATREPLIVFHGSLYKASSPPYLETLLGLLLDDDALELVLMGTDDGVALASIRAEAQRLGVGDRVRYEGSFSLVRSGDGSTVADAGWRRLEGLLARARLAPDPWPIGGAGARVEAYLAGTPGAHMAVRFDKEAWGRTQHATLEIPRLLVPEASATTIPAYVEICRRCLYDGDFADRVAAAQLAAVEGVLDARAYWLQLLDAYRGRLGAGAAA